MTGGLHTQYGLDRYIWDTNKVVCLLFDQIKTWSISKTIVQSSVQQCTVSGAGRNILTSLEAGLAAIGQRYHHFLYNGSLLHRRSETLSRHEW